MWLQKKLIQSWAALTEAQSPDDEKEQLHSRLKPFGIWNAATDSGNCILRRTEMNCRRVPREAVKLGRSLERQANEGHLKEPSRLRLERRD